MDLSVNIGPLRMKNPAGVASGTFGYGSEYEDLIPVDELGAIYTKAVTIEPRPGNKLPRIVETPGSGLLNSIGLANVGAEAFARDKYPWLKQRKCAVIVNLAGSTEDDYVRNLEYLEEHAPLDGYEVNVSCPNVKCGGMAMGTDPGLVEHLTQELRKRTKRALMLKLSPNVTDIARIALAAEAGGADAITCINTLVGMMIDTKRKKTVLPMITGGLSGPAIFPVALAAVWKVSRAVRIPVVGIGGISEPDHAIQFLLAGASAIQTGTVNFVEPRMPILILDAIRDFMTREKLDSIKDFHGLMS